MKYSEIKKLYLQCRQAYMDGYGCSVRDSVEAILLYRENKEMRESFLKIREAVRDNLKAYYYKNEELLYEAFKECEKWIKE